MATTASSKPKWWEDQDDKELPAKFMIGDMVKLKQANEHSDLDPVLIGKTGILKVRHTKDIDWWAVEFDEKLGTLWLLHDCDGHCQNQRGWWAKEDDLILINRRQELSNPVDTKATMRKIDGLLGMLKQK